MTIEYSLLALYALALVGIGIWAARKESIQDFFIAHRKVGVVRTVASIVAVIGGVFLTGGAALAADLGWSALALWIGIAAGMVVLGLGAARLRSQADVKDYLTQSEFFVQNAGRNSGILAAALLFIAFFALLTGQFVVAGILLSGVFPISYVAVIFVLAILVGAYLMLGGYKAVLNTDLLQSFLIISLLVVIVVAILWTNTSTIALNFDGFLGLDPLILFLSGFFVLFGSPDVWQRIYSAKSEKVARNALLGASTIFLLLGTAVTVLGMLAAKSGTLSDSGNALSHGLFQIVPPVLVVLSVLFVVTAVMSTIDTEVFYLASSVKRDFVERLTNRTLGKNSMRASMATIALASAVIASLYSDIITLLFGLISLQLSVAPAAIGLLFFHPHKNSVFASLACGAVAFAALFFFGVFSPDTSSITLPAAAIGLIASEAVRKWIL